MSARTSGKKNWGLLAAVVLAVAIPLPAMAGETCDAHGVALKDGEPAENVLVTVNHDPEDGTGSRKYHLFTDSSGEFALALACGGTASVKLEDDSRTDPIDGLTDFGTWDIQGMPGDNDRDGILDSEEESLLATYAPELRLHYEDWTKPANVPWILSHTTMRFTHDGGCSDCGIISYGHVTLENMNNRCHQTKNGICSHSGSCKRSDSFAPSDGDYNVGFFLQEHNGDHSGIAQQTEWVTYGHAYPGDDGNIILQYWFPYAYNDSFGGFNHEGDWEFVAVILNEDDNPVELIYSQHSDPQSYSPDAVSWVSGNHPVVYVAKGSHANYAAVNSDGDCIGGPFYDNCSNQGVHWDTWDDLYFGGISHVGEKMHNLNDSEWLHYSGRWGEIGNSNDTTGPRGPAYQWSRWHTRGGGEICDNHFDDDIDGAIDETSCTPLPDLVITEVSPTRGGTGGRGDSVTSPYGSFGVRLAVENQGSTVDSEISVDLWLSSDESLDDGDLLLSDDCDIPGLAQGETHGPTPLCLLTLPSSEEDGSYWVIAEVDPEDAIDEGYAGDTNNVSVSAFRVKVLGNTLMLDNFDDQVANEFVTRTGVWTAESTAYRTEWDITGTSTTDVEGESHLFEFDATASTDSCAWDPYTLFAAILRYVDEDNRLYLDFYDSNLDQRVALREKVGGEVQTLLDEDIAGSIVYGYHHYSIEDSGCNVKLTIDSDVIFSHSYSSDLAAGTLGFYNGWPGGTFDNVVISTLDNDGDDDGYSYCTDCDDGNAAVHPNRSEECWNSIDDNCNGEVDEGCHHKKPPTPAIQ